MIDPVNDSRAAWSLGQAIGRLPELLGMLFEVNVEPSQYGRWQQLKQRIWAGAPEIPAGVLSMDQETVGQLADRLVMHAGSVDAVGNRQMALSQLESTLDREFLESMQAEHDTYIAAMRPAFDAAAAAARNCATAGIDPSDLPEQIMRRGSKAIAAWMAFTDSDHVDTLERIASTRIALSLTLGVWPVRRDQGGAPIDYGVCFTQPYAGGFSTKWPHRPGSDERWRRWVTMGPNLHLNSLHEIPLETRTNVLGEFARDTADL